MRMMTLCGILCLGASFFSFSHAGGPMGVLGFQSEIPLRVSVDGKPVGRTPIKALKVVPGRHMVRYESEKEKSTFEFEVIVSDDKPLLCNFDSSTGVHRCSTEKETPGINP